MVRLLPRAFALAAVAALLSACSSLDASKPGSWIDTIAGGGSEGSGEAKTAPPPPSAGDKPTVPASARTASSSAGSDQTNDPEETPASAKPKPSSLPTERAAGEPVDYPSLANQQDLQTSGTTESQRREIRDSLISDRDQAQHSADVLRGGTEKPAVPPPPAPPKPAAEKPADEAKTDEKPADGSASTPAPTE
jgi:hypothetical protein